MSPRGFPPHMPSNGKGFRRRPNTGSRGGVEARAAADASRRPAAYVEPDAAGATVAVAGAAAATNAVVLEPVEEGAMAV